jgi:hypothetical protein
MILGLFIFLAGAVSGSLFDNFFFRGKAWDHNITDLIEPSSKSKEVSSDSVDISIASRAADDFGYVAAPPEISAEESSDKTVAIDENNDSSSSETSEDMNQTDQQQLQASDSEKIAADNDIKSASETVAVEETSAGPLKYKKVETLVKEKTASYHGFLSNDLTELVFASNRDKVNGTQKYQCFLKKIGDSSESEKLFSWPGNVWTPELTPDGNLVVFSSDSRKHEHIFVYNRKNKVSNALTEGLTKNMMPAISPDGTLVAYVSNEKGKNDIWLVGIDGSNKIQITNSPEDDREPRWLPDGSGLVFSRIFQRLKKSHIMKVVLEPLGDPIALVDDDSRNWLPDMSSDGRHLAFVRSMSDNGSKNTLFVKDLETGKETAVKPVGDAESFRPVWTNDARSFVFHANIERSKNIYRAYFDTESQN